MSVHVGQGHDNRTVNINTDTTQLAVSLSDGRKFSTQLCETVVPEATSVSYKGARCIVKLLKNDPTINWPHLEVKFTVLSPLVWHGLILSEGSCKIIQIVMINYTKISNLLRIEVMETILN